VSLLRDAVARANEDPALGPTWSAAGVIAIGAIRVERYRLEGGPTLLVAADDWAPAFVLDTWIPIEGDEPLLEAIAKRERAIEKKQKAVSAARGGLVAGFTFFGAIHPNGTGCEDPTAAAVERAIARFDQAVAHEQKSRAPSTVRERLREELRRRTNANEEPAFDPRRVLFVAAGRVDRAALLFELRRAAGARPRLASSGPLVTSSATAAPMLGEGRLELEVDRPHVSVAWLVDGPIGERGAPLEAVSAMIARSLPPSARSLEISIRSGVDRTLLEAAMVLEPAGSSSTAIARLQQSIDRLADPGPTGAELASVRGLLRSRSLTRLDDLGDRATSIAIAELQGGVESLRALAEGIERLSSKEISELARGALSVSNRAAAISEPEKTKPRGAKR
jgi:hypothetical protein